MVKRHVEKKSNPYVFDRTTGLHALPLATRKRILAGGVTLCAVLIVFGWLKMHNIRPLPQTALGGSAQTSSGSIAHDLGETVAQFQAGLKTVTQAISDVKTAATNSATASASPQPGTPALTADQLATLKAKLEAEASTHAQGLGASTPVKHLPVNP